MNGFTLTSVGTSLSLGPPPGCVISKGSIVKGTVSKGGGGSRVGAFECNAKAEAVKTGTETGVGDSETAGCNIIFGVSGSGFLDLVQTCFFVAIWIN